MTNLRFTIAMFILAAALAPAFLVSWHNAKDAGEVQTAAAPIVPVVPVGFKQVPWAGEAKKRLPAPPPDASAAPASKPIGDAPLEKASTLSERTAMVNTPVVVELFTSEGCSSCPPADKVISELAGKADGAPVYFLVYHVDYWDKLGWKDRFADAAYTERQRTYANVLKSESVYTPQTIVNGAVGFVGSDKPRTEASISVAKVRKPTASLAASIAPWKPGQTATIKARMSLVDAAASSSTLVLCAALVEDGLTSEIKRGENAGRVLRHDRVVRAFAQVAPSSEGEATIELKVPGDVQGAKASVVVFAQDPKTMKIVASMNVNAQEEKIEKVHPPASGH